MTPASAGRVPRRQAGSRRRTAARTLRMLPRLPTAHWRALPDFVVIGAMRCGTTALFSYLERHPLVMGPVTSRKEVHFFDANPTGSVSRYRVNFPLVRGSRNGRGRPVIGESTPYYVFHPRVHERLHKTIPEAKLIVLLRDPVARAFSHYRYEVAVGREALTFEEAMDREEERLHGEEERLRTDPRYVSVNHADFSYLARGRYAEQLERYLRLFRRDQLLVLQSEELYSQPQRVYDRTLAFLGLPRFEPDTFTPHNVGGDRTPMGEAERRRITKYYEQHNERLFELLGETYDW
jgi:hypothetical protein